jgi:uroporphyrinogen III methyltransferase/synthase
LRAHAAAGRRVVRLVGGDGEAFHDEATTLRAWGVGFDVIPGVAPGVVETWLARRPLHGRRVLVTRPKAQAGRLSGLLEAYGAEAITLPAIRIVPPQDWGPLDEAVRSLGTFRWVVFTSVNGVAAFRERLLGAGLDARSLAGRLVAAIGPETAEALRRGGIEPDLVPAEYRAEGLLDALRPRVGRGDAVLLVRAAEARDVLPRELEAQGVRVTVAPAYRTVLAREGSGEIVALLESRRIDVVTFTSSSTVRGFLALLAPADPRRLLEGVVVAAIGPITAETAAEHGLQVNVMPHEYTVPALADAIADHFETSPPATLRG